MSFLSLHDDSSDLPPLPELSPKLQSLAEAVIEEGPHSLIALFGYILTKTNQDERWNSAITDAMKEAGISPEAFFGEPMDLDDGLIYKVKITLRGFRPAVYRELEVPNMTLGELHQVIQAAMGWQFSHQHCFTINKEEYGELNPDLPYDAWQDEEAVSLGQLVQADRRKFTYEYDFGDSWVHDILISKPKAPLPDVFYPRCIKGELACPPEDCGGFPGYLQLCELLQTPESAWSDDDKEYMSWMGKFDPQAFSVEGTSLSLKSLWTPPESPPKKKNKSKAKKK